MRPLGSDVAYAKGRVFGPIPFRLIIRTAQTVNFRLDLFADPGVIFDCSGVGILTLLFKLFENLVSRSQPIGSEFRIAGVIAREANFGLMQA